MALHSPPNGMQIFPEVIKMEAIALIMSNYQVEYVLFAQGY